MSVNSCGDVLAENTAHPRARRRTAVPTPRRPRARRPQGAGDATPSAGDRALVFSVAAVPSFPHIAEDLCRIFAHRHKPPPAIGRTCCNLFYPVVWAVAQATVAPLIPIKANAEPVGHARIHQTGGAGRAVARDSMRDWNVVVTVHEEGYRTANRTLREFGRIEPSSFHNLLLMKVDDPQALLEALEDRAAAAPDLVEAISRIAPATACFTFTSASAFQSQAKATVLEWLPRLANASFHVRLHHRGSELDSPAEERCVADALLGGLEAAGTPGRIAFDDPDAIIAIDTVGGRAGLGLWTRDDLNRYRFLRPD